MIQRYLQLAWLFSPGKLRCSKYFLEHDLCLSYEFNISGPRLLSLAVSRGNDAVGTELFASYPDVPCWQATTWLTSLHEVVICERTNFIKFIIETHQLHRLFNTRYNNRKTTLHYAVAMCRLDIVAMMLSHPDIDTTIVDQTGAPPTWELRFAFDHAKTIDWVKYYY